MSNEATDCRLVRVLSALTCEPWMLTPEMHRTLTDIARAHAFGGRSESDQHVKAAAFGSVAKKREFAVAGSTAVIPCEGVIGRKFDNCLQCSGVVSIDIWERMLNPATEDEEIDSVLLVFDSPGGSVAGVPEAAAAVARAVEAKPVIAHADGQMCSAAYYIASQASQVYAMPSAHVGSIGVYLALLDQTRWQEMMGLRTELFKSGKHKGLGMPGTTLTEEQRAMLQARVDSMGAQFRAAVCSGRERAIETEAMQGQTFDVDGALAAGLIDGVCGIDEALGNASFMGKNRKQTKGTIR
jgi:protease-4